MELDELKKMKDTVENAARDVHNTIQTSASFGVSAIMRPSTPACSGVTCAMEGICSLGTIKKCTGAHGWMSWKEKISSS